MNVEFMRFNYHINILSEKIHMINRIDNFSYDDRFLSERLNNEDILTDLLFNIHYNLKNYGIEKLVSEFFYKKEQQVINKKVMKYFKKFVENIGEEDKFSEFYRDLYIFLKKKEKDIYEYIYNQKDNIVISEKMKKIEKKYSSFKENNIVQYYFNLKDNKKINFREEKIIETDLINNDNEKIYMH